MSNGSARGTYGTNTVTTTAEVLAAAGQRESIIIQNVHASNDLYVGLDDQVTSANGIRIQAGQSIEFSDFTGPVWVIASAAGTDVRFIEVGAV